MPGTSWPRRCSARISGMPSSAIQVLWLCLSPCGVRPGLTGSQQASGVSSGMAWVPLPRGGGEECSGARLGWCPHGDRDARPNRGIGDDQPWRAAGCRFEPPITGGAEHTPGIVAAPVVPAVWAEEYIAAGPAVLCHARAWVPWLVLDLAGEQVGQERREVDGKAWFPGWAAVGVVFGREPVEGATELTKLPLDVDLAGRCVLGFQADRFTPAHPGVGDRDDNGEVVAAAGQQRGPFGDK
jgi:hypothetical protein